MMLLLFFAFLLVSRSVEYFRRQKQEKKIRVDLVLWQLKLKGDYPTLSIYLNCFTVFHHDTTPEEFTGVCLVEGEC